MPVSLKGCGTHLHPWQSQEMTFRFWVKLLPIYKGGRVPRREGEGWLLGTDLFLLF